MFTGVPEMITSLPTKLAKTPSGNPVTVTPVTVELVSYLISSIGTPSQAI